MATTRPGTDPADAIDTTTERSLSSTTTSESASGRFQTTPVTLTTLSTTSLMTSDTTSTGMSTFSTSTTSRSTTADSSTPAVLETSSTGILWGPDITAAPLPSVDSASGGSSIGSPPPAQDSGFSKGRQQVTIATTTLGGTLILAFLIYALCRRTKGATLTEIVRFRPHSGTIVLTPPPREDRFTAFPICREYRYSVHSSRYQSTTSLSRASRVAPDGIPRPVANRSYDQNPYIKNLWKTANPPPPQTLAKEGRSFLVDTSPPLPPPKMPEMARIYERRLSARSHKSQQSSGDTTKSGFAISIRDTSPLVVEPTTPPLSPPMSFHNAQDRWSWTNSQAPSTPRMYAPSLRSSISSLPRFRNVKSWVRGQTHRIDEERPATSSTATRPMLKNKASLPRLAPPPTTRKLSKKNRRVGSVGQQ